MSNDDTLNDKDDDLFADELKPGHTLMQGQYTIESFLNAGGFGITYAARDSLDRKVVIKECFPSAFCRRATEQIQARTRVHQKDLANVVRLFVQEARSLSKLNHPNIVGVHQVFEENSTAYMALDFVEGKDLLDVIDDENQSIEPAVVEVMLRKLLDAVGFVHKQGVLHRDISPDNVLLTPEFEPILIDFGAAQDEAGKQTRALSALRVVKDGYSPQEFYITGSEQQPSSDLYALGATFYHLITGNTPPNAQTRLAAMAGSEDDPFEKVAGRFPEYSDAFLSCIDMSLEILPKNRIETAPDWIAILDGAKDISDYKGAPEVAGAATAAVAANTPEKAGGSSKGLLLGGVAVAACLIGGFVVTQTDILSGSSTDDAVVVVSGAAEDGASEIASAANDASTENTNAASDDAVDVFAAQPEDITSEVEAEQEVEATPEVAAAPEVEVEPEVEAAPEVAVTSEVEAAPEAAVVAEVEATPSEVAPEVSETPDAEALEATADAIVTEVEAAEVEVAEAENLSPPSNLSVDVPAQPQGALDALSENTQEAALENGAALSEAPVRLATLNPEVENNAVAAQSNFEFIPAESDPIPEPVIIEPVVVDAVDPELYEISGVQSGWITELPYYGIFNNSAGETRIFSVNGSEVTGQRRNFEETLRQTSNAPTDTTMTLTVEIGTSLDTAQVQEWVLPVVQRTFFDSGLTFETRFVNSAWITTVISVPEGLEYDLSEGDLIVGDLSENKSFDARTSLPDFLISSVDAERPTITFAVNRGGSLHVVSMPNPAL